MLRELAHRVAPATRARLALAALALYLVSSIEFQPLFFANQNTYFVQGLRFAGVDGLHDDWFSSTRSPHLAFNLLVAGLQQLRVLAAGARAIEVALAVALVWAVWTLASRARAAEVSSDAIAFLSCASFLILVTERGPWRPLFTWVGLAQQFAFGGYLQPSEFGILLFVALACGALERRSWCIAWLIVAATLHVSYLLPAGAIAAAIAVERFVAGQRRSAGLLIASFALGVSPVVVYSLTFGGGDAQLVDQARTLLAREIIPQHAWPAFWWSPGMLMRTSIMAIGCLLAWRVFTRPVAMALTALLGLVIVGTGYVYLTSNTAVAVLFPWRGSVVLYPLSLLLIVHATVTAMRRVSERVAPAVTSGLVAVGVTAIAAVLIGESVRELSRTHAPMQFPFTQRVAAQTTLHDQIIIPVVDADVWNRFRLLTMRPILVDRKNHPYEPQELLEWKRRMDAVAALYALPAGVRVARCAQLGGTYLVAVDNEAEQGLDGVIDSALRLERCTPH